MATKFVTNLDLNGNQLLNGRFEAVAADPSTGNFEGRLIYRTDLDCIKYYDGSAWKVLVKSVASAGDHDGALTISESGGAITITPNLASGDEAGLLSTAFYTDLNSATSSNTNGTLAKRDSNGRLQVTAPSAELDAANKAYVDAARSGLDVKQSARLATNAALSSFTHAAGVLTANANGGLVIDGVTLTDPTDVGIRILVKNETSTNAPYNGIYTVTAVGDESNPWVLTRATDADSNDEVTPGLFVFVEQGTNWADSGWVLTTDGTITLGTTNLTFVQFSAAGQSIAGNGLTKTGNTIDVVGTADRIVANADSIDIASTYVGQSSITTLGTIGTGTWEATDVGVAHGGTGASSASDARTNLGATASGFSTSTPVLARVASQTVGNAADTSFTITHNFDTRDVVVQVYDTATYDTVIADTLRTSTNIVTVSFATAPGNNAYRVVVTG
jgi:hypothetical protein